MFFQSKIVITQNNNIQHIKSLAGLDNISCEEIIVTSEETNIGLEQVQNSLQKLSKKNDGLLLYLVLNSEKLTTEAQNSLLKIVEEPNQNIQILFHTNNLDKLITTTVSRCETIYGKGSLVETDNTEHIFRNFPNLDYKERRNTIEKFLKEDHNKNEIKRSILVILAEIASKKSYTNQLEALEKAYKAIDLNVNPKLVFDFLILSFEK